MIIQKVAVCDIIETNAYFYIDEVSGCGWLIDPGAEADKLFNIIKEKKWNIESILVTHGHFDHIGAVDKISKELGIPYIIHREGKKFLENPDYNLSQYFDRKIVLSGAEYFEDGDIISLQSDSGVQLKVIHTPGHTPDSVIFYDEDNSLAFVGDTIFKNAVGNTSFPGGDERTLRKSITEKIFSLPDNTILYSGHSEETTVGAEK